MGLGNEGDDYIFKVVLIGDSAVGKSNLLSRYSRDEFHLNCKATIGVEFVTQRLEIDGKEVKAQIWDTAGQERFRAVTSAYYRGTAGAMIVYDISQRQSFENVENWLEELRVYSHSSNLVTMLVGNKSDLEHIRQVPREEAAQLAEREGMFFLETSALNKSNVMEAFETVIREIFGIMSRRTLSGNGRNFEVKTLNNGLKVDLEDDSKAGNMSGRCCSV